MRVVQGIEHGTSPDVALMWHSRVASSGEHNVPLRDSISMAQRRLGYLSHSVQFPGLCSALRVLGTEKTSSDQSLTVFSHTEPRSCWFLWFFVLVCVCGGGIRGNQEKGRLLHGGHNYVTIKGWVDYRPTYRGLCLIVCMGLLLFR